MYGCHQRLIRQVQEEEPWLGWLLEQVQQVLERGLSSVSMD
jgi:hypothetical protein